MRASLVLWEESARTKKSIYMFCCRTSCPKEEANRREAGLVRGERSARWKATPSKTGKARKKWKEHKQITRAAKNVAESKARKYRTMMKVGTLCLKRNGRCYGHEHEHAHAQFMAAWAHISPRQFSPFWHIDLMMPQIWRWQDLAKLDSHCNTHLWHTSADEVALKEAIDLSLKRDSNLASMERIEADTSEAEEEARLSASVACIICLYLPIDPVHRSSAGGLLAISRHDNRKSPLHSTPCH